MSLALQAEVNSLNEDILFDINHQLRGVYATLMGLLIVKNMVPPPGSNMEPITDLEFDLGLKSSIDRLGKIIEMLQAKYQ